MSKCSVPGCYLEHGHTLMFPPHCGHPGCRQADSGDMSHSVRGFHVGERVLLDHKVPGHVDGFYKSYIVFRPQLIHSMKYLYGRMPLGDNIDPVENEEIKVISFSLVLVHPSNLTRTNTK